MAASVTKGQIHQGVVIMDKFIFPKDFRWGVATAAYQIEGGAGADGKGESIWDRFCHAPDKIANGDTGDTACDHYHRYSQDIKLMKKLGLKNYRLSLAWSRLFPNGTGALNQKGADFYSRLIDELLQQGIEPMVTLYHWDLPQALQDRGGWGNGDIADWFADYATGAFELLGDRVKTWLTHNEPWVVAYAGHRQGRHAPGLTDFGLAVQVSHNLMLSHAKAVQVYRGANHPGGRIGIALNLYPITAASDAPENQEAARRADGYHNRWFLDPVLRGEYPQDMLKFFQESFGTPSISPGDLELLKSNPVDFLGINYYFRKIVKHGSIDPVLHLAEVKPESSQYTAMNWEIHPQSLTELLVAIAKNYNNPAIVITENGAAFADSPTANGAVDDDDRLAFLRGHFEEAHRAIQAGVRLEGFYVWSLLDNFEWACGYDKRFGLIYVDYPTQQRTFKKSALWYRDVIKANGL